jgi:hypothetical protein
VLADGGGGGGRFAMLGNTRSGGVGLGCAELEVTGSIGRREVGRVARGQTGGMGGADMRTESIDWARGIQLIDWTVKFR